MQDGGGFAGVLHGPVERPAASALRNLGTAYRHRFPRSGLPADIDLAVAVQAEQRAEAG